MKVRNKNFRNVKTGRTFDNINEVINTQYFFHYYDRIKEIATNRFNWKNLPISCNERKLEEQLFEHGKVGFAEVNNLGLAHGRIVNNGLINFYGEYTGYYLYGENNQNFHYSSDEIIVMRANSEGVSLSEVVTYYAHKLANIERTIDVNLKAQRTPLLITGEENQMDSLKLVYEKYDENHPVIFADKYFNPDSVRVLKTDAPYLIDKLRQEKKEVWSEMLTFFGVDNLDINKKERLITDEVNSNKELISLGLDMMYKFRKKAADEINEKFGENIEIEIRNIENLDIENKEGEEWNTEITQ